MLNILYIPNKQVCGDGGTKNFLRRGINLERIQTLKGTQPYLGDAGSVFYVVKVLSVLFK